MKLLWHHTHGLAEGTVALRADSLRSYTRRLQTVVRERRDQAPEASLLLPDVDMNTVFTVSAAKAGAQLRYVVVIGIGGSNLGTQAIYDALYGYADLATYDRPRMLFIDTVNAAVLHHHIERVIPSLRGPEEVLLVTISKSGGTTETVANTEILLAAYRKAFGDMTDRTVVISDQDAPYADAAAAAGCTRFFIPKLVGGRYSVLSPVGLFPLAALGCDVESLRQGAQDIMPYCLNDDWEHNPAVQSAVITALSYEQGKVISDLFLFHSELESLGKWYRQLLGESIGKAERASGAAKRTGITPTVSIGSTDLHSVGQLYLGGPQRTLTTFVYSDQAHDSLRVPASRTFPDVVPMINDRSTHEIMEAILGGTKAAYTSEGLPFMQVALGGITPYELGAFMQYKMIEMMYLGQLLDVNPFDQPSVELYKQETKRLLENG